MISATSKNEKFLQAEKLSNEANKNDIQDGLFDRTIGDWIDHWVKYIPDHRCLTFPATGLKYTWKQLSDRADNMALGLLRLGVKKGTNVGVWATNVPDWMTILFATAKIGAVLVTVNTNYKQNEIEFVCRDANIHTLFIIDGTWESDYIGMVYKMLPELKTQPKGKLSSASFPDLKNVIYIGDNTFDGMFTAEEVVKIGKTEDRTVLEQAKKDVNSHDAVNMQYTSGTTGFPKGVMLSHHNICNNGYYVGENMDFTASDKLCLCVPMFHCFGIVLATMNWLTHGFTMVMVEKFHPLMVLSAINSERCTSVYGVPTMFLAELNHPWFKLFDCSSLRTGIMAGALCPEDLVRRVETEMYMKVTSVYGLTETSPGMTHSTLSDSFSKRCKTVGKELPLIDVKVLNPDTGEECPVGVQGEMCCKGYNVMLGYYHNQEATDEIIDKNGYLHSGDLGIKDRDGYFHITGRIKDMIIRGGENIYPKEIEEFIRTMEGVSDVQVAGIPSKKYGEQVGAFIKLHNGIKMTDDDIRNYCNGTIARYKVPKYVFFLDEYPQTASGKVQKFRLTELGIRMCAERNEVIV